MSENLQEQLLPPEHLNAVQMIPYSVNLSLNRLRTGIDNIRYDVYLSDSFCEVTRQILFQMLARHTHTEEVLCSEGTRNLIKEKEDYRKICRDILITGINRAKLEGEVQLDALVQLSIIKLILEEIRAQYATLLERLKSITRGYEMSSRHDEAIAMKKRQAEIAQERHMLLRLVCQDVFQILEPLHTGDLNEMRRANFGDEAVILDDLYASPMLTVDKPTEDYFTLNAYCLLFGHRLEDADRYTNLVSLLQNLLTELKLSSVSGSAVHDPASFLKNQENIDRLFNYPLTRLMIRKQKKNREDSATLLQLKHQEKAQRQRLHFLFRRFRRLGLIRKIIAAYEIQPIYLDYCPPLVPHLMSQYFISFRARRNVGQRLKRLRKFYGNSLSVTSLRKKRWSTILQTIKGGKKPYLIRFLRDFACFHRDMENYRHLQETLETIHLVTEKKQIQLSQTNNTLYEFRLPHESAVGDQPIINHVIIKADVRGSTDITHRMMEMGRNPATHFSRNFFEPINGLLHKYGAQKVFVEGDAIILSIFEHEQQPEGFYSVARACGLAGDILAVVRQGNRKNRKAGLPEIELGIGISYKEGKPAFLFDGDERIMISSAINKADRLAGCSKRMRRLMFEKRKPFNLYVMQTVSDKDMSKTVDDIMLRYNVNGIELNGAGFRKLKTEINLQPVPVDIYKFRKYKIRFYTGKFPTVTGSYQRLVVRKAPVPKVTSESFGIKKLTNRRYYEVCTSPKLHAYIKKQLRHAMTQKNGVA